jgi:hypothetical protein
MNRAAQKVGMGTEIRRLGQAADIAISASSTQRAIAGASGSATVTSAQASANRVVLSTGLTTIKGFITQASRSGSPIIQPNVISGSNAGTLVFQTATTGCAVALAADDSLWYMAW